MGANQSTTMEIRFISIFLKMELFIIDVIEIGLEILFLFFAISARLRKCGVS